MIYSMMFYNDENGLSYGQLGNEFKDKDLICSFSNAISKSKILFNKKQINNQEVYVHVIRNKERKTEVNIYQDSKNKFYAQERHGILANLLIGENLNTLLFIKPEIKKDLNEFINEKIQEYIINHDLACEDAPRDISEITRIYYNKTKKRKITSNELETYQKFIKEYQPSKELKKEMKRVMQLYEHLTDYTKHKLAFNELIEATTNELTIAREVHKLIDKIAKRKLNWEYYDKLFNTLNQYSVESKEVIDILEMLNNKKQPSVNDTVINTQNQLI